MHKTLQKPQLLSRAQCIGQHGFHAEKRTLRHPFPLHAHEFFEIELILSGEGTQMLNGREYPVREGSLTFLTPTDFHSVTPQTPLRYYNVMFSEEFCMRTEGAASLLSGDGICFTLSGKELQIARGLLYALAAEDAERADNYTLAYWGSLLETVLILLLRSMPELPKSASSSPVQAVLYRLHRHFCEPFSLADAARIAHLSPHYFSTVFKETTGVGFSDYLSRLRLRYAYRCLALHEYSVTEICYRAGFGAFSSFARAFKAYYGMTPSEVRALFSEVAYPPRKTNG